MTTHDEATMREALRRLTAAAWHQNDPERPKACFSIPADPERDADLILGAAIDELLSTRAQLDEARARLAMAAWRKEPPTVEEVRACEWWWCRWDGQQYPARMAVNDMGRVVEMIDGREYDPGEADAEWLPCIPATAPAPGLVEAARDFVDVADRAEAARTMRTGMQAPYHDDFSNVAPSTARALRKWADRFRAALPKETPNG